MPKGLPKTIGPRSRGALVKLPTYTVATVPGVAANVGCLIRVSNGAAGSPCLAVSNGTNWLQVAVGAAIAAA